MSRRLRVEEEKAKQLNLDLQDEEDKLKLQQERIFGPLLWRRLQSGIKIQDLQSRHFEEVLDMIETHYTPEDVIFKNSRYAEDEPSQKSFRERLLFNMKERSSIVAVDEAKPEEEQEVKKEGMLCKHEEKKDIIAGALLLKVINKFTYGRVFSRVQIVEGDPYISITNFTNYLNRKVDVFEQFQCNEYLRYYLLCIHPDYRKKGLGYHLMSVGLDIARHFNLSIVMGVFNNFKTQKIAKRLGMQVLDELEYVKWVDKAGELVFCNPGAGNYTCAVMAGIVPPPPAPVPIPKKVVEQKPNTKQTRAEKRKEKGKKK